MDCLLTRNYFEDKITTMADDGICNDESALGVIEAYLAGKPARTKKQNSINKDQLFWSSKFLWNLNVDVLQSDAFILALARYCTVDKFSNFSLIEQITYKSPEAIKKAIRSSEIVLRPRSNKWIEVKQLAERAPYELSELIAVCKAFQCAHQERLNLVAKYQDLLKDLTVFELLSYSSLYAFKYLFNDPDALDGSVISTDERFRALKKLVEWKLYNTKSDSFNLTDMKIANSLKVHQAPLLFPSQEDTSTLRFYLHRFEKLMQAQVELDGFLSRNITPFCFDDECEYFLDGDRLEMRRNSDIAQQAWLFNVKKQNLIDGYWVNRGLQEFIERGLAGRIIGSEENHEENQIAYIKSLGAYLQLSEIYGLDKVIQTDLGLRVDVHQSLLALELMIEFYNKDYIAVFSEYYLQTGNWEKSLGMLAFGGLTGNGEMQNRFSITWLEWKKKAKNIVGWTVSKTFPNGNIKAAEAILDFWSLDFKKWSIQLQANNRENLPQLTERPIFKLGNYSVQLPWMMATQQSNVNVINTLRRFANKRPEIQDETSRIETNLGKQFKKRGFIVIEGYHPEKIDKFNPGEIDLICVLDNTVLVIEVKSTYRRTSQREAIRYKHSTLRKAGLQIKRKTEAVKYLLATNEDFHQMLGIRTNIGYNVIGWIADTSLKYDHEYFNGFLKVSVEELHIALRDEAEMLVDLIELAENKTEGCEKERKCVTLYPAGFNIKAFLGAVIDCKLWAEQ